MKKNKGTHKNKAAGLHARTAPKKPLNAHDISLANQQAIVLSALRKEGQTTASLRHEYGVMHPSARVQELKEIGHRIDTLYGTVATPDGIKHKRVAQYVLLPKEVCHD